MALTPDTNIRLLKVPFEIDNKNQLTFSSKQAQTNYFLGLPAIEIDKAQYQRKDNIMYFPAHIDSIMQYNYVMYQNKNYSDKWFYAFITNKSYNNDGLTDLTLKTDVFQTWQFDIIYKRSFIEREHVNDDTIGKNIIEENLNVGAVIEESHHNSNFHPYYSVIIECSYSPKAQDNYKQGDFDGVAMVNRQIMGTMLYCFNLPAQFEAIGGFIRRVNKDGKKDSITNMYIVPSALVPETQPYENFSSTDSQGVAKTYTCSRLVSSSSPKIIEESISKQHSFSNYTPKNNKLFCYPYNYLYVTNHNGSSNIYKYEDFNSENCDFKIYSALNVGMSVKTVPQKYKGIENNDDESIPLGKYPTCSWSTDSYTNWLTQQAVNIPVSILSSALSLGVGMATGGASLAVESAFSKLSENELNARQGLEKGKLYSSSGVSAFNQIGNLVGGFYQASILPNIQNGTNTGDINYSNGDNVFTYRKMRARKQYLKIIDDFFSMYGYKINEVKTPNITGRRNWNYVKTIDCNLLGEIPQDDLEELKQIFNNGVTFWHNPLTFLDYSQNNNIV